MRHYRVYMGLQDLACGSVESAARDRGGPFFVRAHASGAVVVVEPVVSGCQCNIKNEYDQE